MLALCVVQAVPVFLVPLEQLQEFATHALPLLWKPVQHVPHLARLLLVHAVPVALLPFEHVHVFVTHALPLLWKPV